MKKFTYWLLIMMLFPLTLNGSAQEADAPLPPALADGKLTIAWIPKSLNNPVFELGRDGCYAAADELSAELGLTVECLYIGSMASDMAEQALAVEEAILSRVDAIAISCNSDRGCVEPIQRAIDAGIPVMTWDSDSPQSGRFTYLGLDNFLGGRAAADLLIRAMGTEGRVAVLSGVRGAANLDARVNGFRDYMARYPGIEIIEVFYGNDDVERSVTLVENAMRDFEGEIDGWFLAGLWPLIAGRDAMPRFERAIASGMKVVAFDTLPVELQWVEDGLISGLVGQKYWDWGYRSMYILRDYLLNGVEFDSFTDSGMDIVTAENVAVVVDAWTFGDFTAALPPAFPDPNNLFTMAFIAPQGETFDFARTACQSAAAAARALCEVNFASIDDALAAGIEGIAINCTDCADSIAAAQDAGVKVITVGDDLPDSRRMTYLGVDQYAVGVEAAHLLTEQLGSAGNVGVLLHEGDAASEARLIGFTETLADYPDMSIVTVAISKDSSEYAQAVENALSQTADVTGWFFAVDWVPDLDAMPVYSDAGLLSIGVYATPDKLNALIDGAFTGLIGADYASWGADAFTLLYENAIIGTPTYDITPSRLFPVTASNVEDALAAWESGDFSELGE